MWSKKIKRQCFRRLFGARFWLSGNFCRPLESPCLWVLGEKQAINLAPNAGSLGIRHLALAFNRKPSRIGPGNEVSLCPVNLSPSAF